jgi:hypothetical protein
LAVEGKSALLGRNVLVQLRGYQQRLVLNEDLVLELDGRVVDRELR